MNRSAWLKELRRLSEEQETLGEGFDVISTSLSLARKWLWLIVLPVLALVSAACFANTILTLT